MTKRLKFIELRAKSALEGTDEWREYDYPKNRNRDRERLREKLNTALAEYSKLGESARSTDIILENLQNRYESVTAENVRLVAENARLWAVYEAARKLLDDGCWRGSEGHVQLETAVSTAYNPRSNYDAV